MARSRTSRGSGIIQPIALSRRWKTLAVRSALCYGTPDLARARSCTLTWRYASDGTALLLHLRRGRDRLGRDGGHQQERLACGPLLNSHLFLRLCYLYSFAG